MPLVVSRPMKYAPADVARLTDMLQHEVEYAAKRLKINGVPSNLEKFSGKTPTNVFQETAKAFFKLSVLRGQTKITPNTVYAELFSAVGDAKSILGQIDPACRYNIDVPHSEASLKPSDVFQNCLAVRHEINKVRQTLQLGKTAVPVPANDYRLSPIDVFVQTQIIIAELNLLKLGTNTASSTPLAVPVAGKKPENCHQQASMVKHLVQQITSLRTRTATLDRKK